MSSLPRLVVNNIECIGVPDVMPQLECEYCAAGKDDETCASAPCMKNSRLPDGTVLAEPVLWMPLKNYLEYRLTGIRPVFDPQADYSLPPRSPEAVV